MTTRFRTHHIDIRGRRGQALHRGRTLTAEAETAAAHRARQDAEEERDAAQARARDAERVADRARSEAAADR
jgi:hypothetical protein